jgi:uridine kinase
MAQLNKMSVLSIEDLEHALGATKFAQFVQTCEDGFESQLQGVVRRVVGNREIRAVFVSGPTSSGKTTFSSRLADALGRSGLKAHVLSMDDYYAIESIRYDDWGRPDFESLDTLDTALMAEQFQQLLNGKTVTIPTFDFVTRSRGYSLDKILVLHEDDLLIVEGLHGLHQSIAGQLPHHAWLGVFIMPWCSLLSDRQLLGSRDLRILRRISRDVVHRGSTALSTIDYWPMIDKTEQAFFPDYLARADLYINSCLPYEFCVIAPKAYHQIQQSLQEYEDGTLPGSIYLNRPDHYADLESAVAEARWLAMACERIPVVDHLVIPPQSILNEFI